MIPLLTQSKPLIPLLKWLDKMQLMLKRMLMHGDLDGLQAQDQFFPYTNTELSQMDTLSILVTSKLPSRILIVPPRLLDKLLLTLKRPPMPGERDPHQIQDQFFP